MSTQAMEVEEVGSTGPCKKGHRPDGQSKTQKVQEVDGLGPVKG